jgi:Concanavalin A-like lectin/glucanases superfamily
MGSRRSIVTLLLLGACSFEKTVAEQSGVPDARDGAEMMTGGEESTSIAPCKTPDPTGLVVCLEFEDEVGDGMLDDSSPARRTVTSTGLAQLSSMMPMGGTTNVVDVGTAARTYVAQDAALDLKSGYTLAAWIKPDTAPAANTARGVMDHEGQYAMIVSANGTGDMYNRCQHTGVAKYEYTTRLPVGVWQLMACTFDGAELCAWRWASATDHEQFCHAVSLQPAASGTNGLAVGHLSSSGAPLYRFDGALDSVQVYNRAMTEAQLCAMVGQPAGCMPCDGGSCL